MSDAQRPPRNLYPLCLDDILVAIRRRSGHIPATARIRELEGMIELVEYLADADYRMPAILYGFLKSEMDRLE